MRHTFLRGAAAVLLVSAGCYGIDPAGPNNPGNRTTNNNSTNNNGTVGAGIPCDVQDVLSAQCQGCHTGASASGGVSLATYDDLIGPSPANVNQSVAERCVARMNDAQSPMPPTSSGLGRASAADVAVLQQWIDQSMPEGQCGNAETINDPLNAAATCTSGSYWTGGNRESSRMNPGMACIDCHTRMREGPSYWVAGTVYPTGHEPDRCSPSVTSTSVVVTDSNGLSYTLPVNSAGNFYLSRSRTFTMPYTAVVVQGGSQRPMLGAQSNGDCNTCHSQTGTDGAPGRVTLPL